MLFCEDLHLIYLKEIAVKATTDTQTSASYLDLHLEIDKPKKIKRKLYDKRDDFTFSIISTPLISSNVHQSYGFPFHNSYVFLGFVHKTMIYCTELRCWHKSYSNKDPRLKSSLQKFYELVHRYEISISQLTMDLFSLSLTNLSPNLTIRVTRYVSYKKRNCLPFTSTCVHTPPPDIGGVRVAHLFSFLCCVFVCVLYPMLPMSLEFPLVFSSGVCVALCILICVLVLSSVFVVMFVTISV